MRTRSSNKFNNNPSTSTIPKQYQRKRGKKVVAPNQSTSTSTLHPTITEMADLRTMQELLQAPTEGCGDAIVLPEIEAENFELKTGLLNLVTNHQFLGREMDDPHAHIRWFNSLSSTVKQKNVTNEYIKLKLFPFSLEGPHEFGLKKNHLDQF